MMKPINVLLSSRPKLLSDVIKNLIADQPDMHVVGEVIDPLQLLGVASEVPVDVIIITPFKGNGEPRLCHQLLEVQPRLVIVTQLSGGSAAHLYRSGAKIRRFESPSPQFLLDSIREAHNRIIHSLNGA